MALIAPGYRHQHACQGEIVQMMAYLCRTTAGAPRRLSGSAGTGLLRALLPFFPLCCLYLFVLLLHQPNQGVAPSCQFLEQRHTVSAQDDKAKL